jgi:hypothetical protein
MLALLVMVAACPMAAKRDIYTDTPTGYSVRFNQRHHRGIGMTSDGIAPKDGDRGEPGYIKLEVLEYIFASPESPFTRYYDLVLALDDRPKDVVADLKQLEAIARPRTKPGIALRGKHYARALARKLAKSINDALTSPGSAFQGTAGVYWGMSVDLDSEIPLIGDERDGEPYMRNTIIRYASVGLIVIHSSATQSMFVWDVSKVPGAFDRTNTTLDSATVAKHIVALHPTP